MRRFFLLGCSGWGLAFPLGLLGQSPVLTPFVPSSSALFADGVKVAPSATFFFPAGATPGRDAVGDMKTQALATFTKLKTTLGEAGYSLNDVVQVRAYLVPGSDGKTDYAGWNEAWKETFLVGRTQPPPARTSIGVPRLGSPSMLIEIEFVCAKPTSPDVFTGGAVGTSPRLRTFGAPTARIASGVGVLGQTPLYWTAGVVPGKDGGADTRAQARSVLTKLQANLAAAGLTFKDVAFLRCFVAPDPAKGGAFDLDGWNAAYDEFFNLPTQPHKPARTTVTTPTLGSGTLLEVEMIAAAPGAAPTWGTPESASTLLTPFGEANALIASGMGVPGEATFYFSSGTAGLPGATVKLQAMMALTSLKVQLAKAGLTFRDVVFLRAYLVPEPDGSIDRQGWTEAYTSFFSSPANPHKPARTTLPVQSLPSPQMKIEIDVVAAKR